MLDLEFEEVENSTERMEATGTSITVIDGSNRNFYNSYRLLHCKEESNKSWLQYMDIQAGSLQY